MPGRKREKKGIWTDLVEQAIDASWREKAIPPTIRDIMDVTGITSKSVVSYEYRRLCEAGKIEIVRGKPIPKWVSTKIK
jgi:hypothetical protein